MLRAWQITPTKNIELHLEAASLDEITRQLPEGYYSTFRTYDGCTRVLDLSAHLGRLYEPVSEPGVNASLLRRQLLALLEPYRSPFGPGARRPVRSAPGMLRDGETADEARVRVMMTKEGEAYIAIEPLKQLAREVYEQGVRVETTEIQRETPRLKSTTFIGRSEAERKHIAREGIFEALLVKNGKILEGMTSNFFYVVERSGLPHHIGTARDHILLGVTRKTVIHLAWGRGLDVRYRPLRLNELSVVSEAFITSSSRGIVPIVRIDDVTIGEGRPGPITKQLSAVYEAHVREKAEQISSFA